MTEITFRRNNYQAGLKQCQHAGLMLERGFDKWDTENYNAQKKEFYDKLVQIDSGNLYQSAYCRWQKHLKQNNCKSMEATLDGRLYLSLGEANPLESAVTLHHTYGVPFIPGSAVKGVLHHTLLERYATEYSPTERKYIIEEKHQEIIDTLFGREADKNKGSDDSGHAGYIIFNDAWWVPANKNPLVKEIVTVHHPEYYSDGSPATDFDSPNPNQLLAIQGEFLFSVQGESKWADFALKLLKQTLQHYGIGAKTASGYGYFKPDSPLKADIEETWDNVQLSRQNKSGMGMVVEAQENGKTAVQKWETLKIFIDKLPESSLKKLKKGTLRQTIKVKKEGNAYLIVSFIF